MRILTLLILALALSGCDECFADPSEIVYQTIAMESASESDTGMYLVASTIVNRAMKRGTSIEGESIRRKQYSCWNDLEWSKAWLGRFYTEKARKRAKKALERAIREPFKGITHYHTLDVSPYWAVGHKPEIIEGGHAFYSDIR